MCCIYRVSWAVTATITSCYHRSVPHFIKNIHLMLGRFLLTMGKRYFFWVELKFLWLKNWMLVAFVKLAILLESLPENRIPVLNSKFCNGWSQQPWHSIVARDPLVFNDTFSTFHPQLEQCMCHEKSSFSLLSNTKNLHSW